MLAQVSTRFYVALKRSFSSYVSYDKYGWLICNVLIANNPVNTFSCNNDDFQVKDKHTQGEFVGRGMVEVYGNLLVKFEC